MEQKPTVTVGIGLQTGPTGWDLCTVFLSKTLKFSYLIAKGYLIIKMLGNEVDPGQG